MPDDQYTFTDDDDIETAISFRYKDTRTGLPASFISQNVIMDEPGDLPEVPGSDVHGKTADGELACCAIFSTGVVDCAACLTAATQSLLQSLDSEEAEILKLLLDALEDAGPEGLTKEELQVY